jgi:hypothetical protein
VPSSGGYELKHRRGACVHPLASRKKFEPVPPNRTRTPELKRAADIGSIAAGNFGWARLDPEQAGQPRCSVSQAGAAKGAGQGTRIASASG